MVVVEKGQKRESGREVIMWRIKVRKVVQITL